MMTTVLLKNFFLVADGLSMEIGASREKKMQICERKEQSDEQMQGAVCQRK